MLAAWRQAGRAMTRHPRSRCASRGSACAGSGPAAARSTPPRGSGRPRVPARRRDARSSTTTAWRRRGTSCRSSVGPQGDKILALNEKGSVPQAVPFTVLRLGDGLIATVAGEPTVGAGKLIRAAVLAAVARLGHQPGRDRGLRRGLPQLLHDPGGVRATGVRGRVHDVRASTPRWCCVTRWSSSPRRLVAGQPAPAPYPYDPNDGVHVTGAGYGSGAASAHCRRAAGRRAPASATLVLVGWRAERDRPASRPRRSSRFSARPAVAGDAVTDDLGMQILWSSDPNGPYRARGRSR